MRSSTMTEGPVWRALTRVSGPMTFGILAVLSVGVADAYFLGQLGSAPLAAVGFIYPITAALTSLAIGLSAGANAMISQRIGAEASPAEIARVTYHALGFGVALSLSMALLVWLFHGLIFEALGAQDAAMAEIALYMPFWAISFPFLVCQMLLNAVFRAHGSGAMSAAIMIVSAIFAIGLNPVLIFGWWGLPELGTAGAAIATAIGRVVSCVVAVILALKLRYLVQSDAPFKALRQSLSELVRIGGPAAFSNAINPAGMALVTAAVATLGEAAVAGFGAATRVQSVLLVPMLALSAGIGPVVGQNWGADKPERARSAVAWCWGFSLVYGLSGAILVVLFAAPLANLFADGDSDVAGFAAQYLSIVAWSWAGYGMLVTANAAMNGRSKSLYSMGLSIARIGLVYVPMAWLLSWAFGYDGILYAAVLANVAVVLGALWCLARTDLLIRAGRLKPAPARS